ncbi:permease prefix domain 1-containing protein [Alkalicoccobacillus gibsonii]|uniref:permease prefix domain 1-containing protein n=1 Tax=Alkalicoccobacillus gibsonii TaxID=79881 RepID=UPI001AEDFAF7|nr:permease prefix domain 1-containing protein [Alkalicoccobacillus gibsonii]
MEFICENGQSIFGEAIMNIPSYLNELRLELTDHPNKEEILHEYKAAMEAKQHELMLAGIPEQSAEKQVLVEFGNPKEVALSYHQNSSSIDFLKGMISINYFIFAIGALLTFFYTTGFTAVTTGLWEQLIQWKWAILLAYCCLQVWMYFKHGYSYGFKGRGKNRQYLFIALLPNYLLMSAVLFSETIHTWFSPLLNPSFLVACIFATIAFYPMNQLAVRIGVVHSI